MRKWATLKEIVNRVTLPAEARYFPSAEKARDCTEPCKDEVAQTVYYRFTTGTVIREEARTNLVSSHDSHAVATQYIPQANSAVGRTRRDVVGVRMELNTLQIQKNNSGVTR